MKKIKYILLLTTCTAIGLLYFAFSNSSNEIVNAQTKPEGKFALLIGINEYNDEKISDLSGTENDVKLMHDLLVDNYKFDPKTEILELVSSENSKTQKPTKANIEAAFRAHLIKNAKAFKEKNPTGNGATILFYYSGHGAYVPDQPTEKEGKDEVDGYDETIVPMDTVRDSETTDIRDDDLNAWFKELKKYTSNITFIFDSCHSGTVTRGSGNKSIKNRVFAKKTSNTRGDAPLNETMDDDKSYVTISGSMPNEQSQEGEIAILPKPAKPGETIVNENNPKEQWNGYLTYYLVKELRENRGISYRELMRAVSTAVNKKNKDQTPQVEGDIDRQFLGTSESRQKLSIPILKVEKVGNDTILTIEAGKIVGALPGGLIGIYKDSAVQYTGETDRIAVGKIIDSLNFTSKVKVSGLDISPKSKIVLATPFFTDQKRKVAIDTNGTDAGFAMSKRLKEILVTNNFFEPIETPITFEGNQNWNIAVVRGKFSQFKEGVRKSAKDGATMPKDTDDVFYLANSKGNPIYNFWVKTDEPNAEDKIREALEKYTRVENMLTLDNAVSNMSGQMEAKLIRLKSVKLPKQEGDSCEVEEYTAAEMKKMDDEKVPFNPGDWYYFEIVNNTDKPLFPYLYNISTDGSIKLIYQPPSPSDILPNGKTLPLFLPKTCSGFSVLQAEEPFGKETFKLIATSQKFEGKMLESSAIAIGRRGKGDESALESLFDQASTNSRNSNSMSIPFSGWLTTKKEIEILPKQ